MAAMAAFERVRSQGSSEISGSTKGGGGKLAGEGKPDRKRKNWPAGTMLKGQAQQNVALKSPQRSAAQKQPQP